MHTQNINVQINRSNYKNNRKTLVKKSTDTHIKLLDHYIKIHGHYIKIKMIII